MFLERKLRSAVKVQTFSSLFARLKATVLCGFVLTKLTTLRVHSRSDCRELTQISMLFDATTTKKMLDIFGRTPPPFTT